MGAHTPFWSGNGLGVGPAGLTIGGQAVSELAVRHGTPLYVYCLASIRERVARLRAALTALGRPTRIYYAIKANRHRSVLEALRAEGDIGIDASSPREVGLALEAGFRPDEISLTASMPSNRDLDAFLASGVHVNLDSLSSLRRYAARAPAGTRVGLRLDAAIEVGYGGSPKVAYGNTKFGIEHEALDAALEAARAGGLEVTTLHVHCGWGLQANALPKIEWLFAHLAAFGPRVAGLTTVNVGGGLVGRHADSDDPLALEAWADALRRHLVPLGCAIACEPGTFLVDDAGILVVEANTVEQKAGTTWVGIDAGHNVNVYMAHYGIPLAVAHVARPLDPAGGSYWLGGNLNESNDVFGKDVRLPTVREGDLLALLPAGAYGASMASDHCLRGLPREIAV